MKKIIAINIICFFILQSCCNVFYSLLNDKKSYCDYSGFSVNKYNLFDFGLGVREDLYKYKNDSLHPRLKFIFGISAPKLPLIKLNSFSFTQEKNKDTIPMKLYYESAYIVPISIDSLPIIIEIDSVNRKHLGFRIVSECNETYNETKKIYINYDIEIGNERIVRKNIEYKRRLQIDCQPRW